MGMDPTRLPDDAEAARNERLVREGLRSKLRRVLGRVPFVIDALAAWHAALDPATPRRVRLILMAALAYFVMPADLVPDFVAVLGYGDDAAVLAGAIRAVAPHIHDIHRERARQTLAGL